jgi:hypothetical protein
VNCRAHTVTRPRVSAPRPHHRHQTRPSHRKPAQLPVPSHTAEATQSSRALHVPGTCQVVFDFHSSVAVATDALLLFSTNHRAGRGDSSIGFCPAVRTPARETLRYPQRILYLPRKIRAQSVTTSRSGMRSKWCSSNFTLTVGGSFALGWFARWAQSMPTWVDEEVCIPRTL